MDCWLPRMHVIANVALVVVCGVLIALGHDSIVTDLFIAGGGAIIGTTSYSLVKNGKAKASESTDA